MRACTDLCQRLKLRNPGHKLRYPGLLSPPVFDLLPMGRSHVNKYQSVTRSGCVVLTKFAQSSGQRLQTNEARPDLPTWLYRSPSSHRQAVGVVQHLLPQAQIALQTL